MTDVVIVDSDEGSRALLERTLRGYTVATALNGVEGLALARRCRPAVVVADAHLAGWSGADVIETLRRERPSLNAVLLTRTGDGISEDLASDGQVQVLSKRTADIDLRPVVTTLLGLPRVRSPRP